MRMNHCSEMSGSMCGAAAVAGRHAVAVVVDLLEHAGGPQVGDDALASLVDGEAGIGAALGGDAPVGADRLDSGQPVVAADVEVGEVVGRRDLEGAAAEARIDALVGDHRQFAPQQGQQRGAPDDLVVALVVGVHGHRRVAEHGLGPGRGDRDRAAALQRVAHVVEVAGFVDVLDLEVADRRAAARAPVDDVVVLVDVAFGVQGHEDLDHCLDILGIEREALALVVAGAAQALDLLDDRVAVLLAPGPDELDELLAADVLLALALRRSCFSTTFWVAMPAWSVPSSQQALSPSMRW